MLWLSTLWHLVTVLAELGPTSLLAGTAVLAEVLLTALLVARLLRRPAVTREVRVTRRTLRERTGRAGIPRHRDPDAPGRSRPRAPTAAPVAA